MARTKNPNIQERRRFPVALNGKPEALFQTENRKRKQKGKKPCLSDRSSGSNSDTEEGMDEKTSLCSARFDGFKWWKQFIDEGEKIYNLSNNKSDPPQYTNKAVLHLLPKFLRGHALAAYPTMVLNIRRNPKRDDGTLYSAFCFHVMNEIPYKEKQKRRPKGQCTAEQTKANKIDSNIRYMVRAHLGKMIQELVVLISGMVFQIAENVVKQSYPSRTVQEFIESKEFYKLANQFKQNYPELCKNFPKWDDSTAAVSIYDQKPEYSHDSFHGNQIELSETEAESDEKRYNHKKAKIAESREKIVMHKEIIASVSNTLKIQKKEKKKCGLRVQAKSANAACIYEIRSAIGYSKCSSSDTAIRDVGSATFDLFTAKSEEEIAKALERLRDSKQRYDLAKRLDTSVGTEDFQDLVKLVHISDSDSSEDSSDEMEHNGDDNQTGVVISNLMCQIEQNTLRISSLKAKEEETEKEEAERRKKERGRKCENQKPMEKIGKEKPKPKEKMENENKGNINNDKKLQKKQMKEKQFDPIENSHGNEPKNVCSPSKACRTANDVTSYHTLHNSLKISTFQQVTFEPKFFSDRAFRCKYPFFK